MLYCHIFIVISVSSLSPFPQQNNLWSKSKFIDYLPHYSLNCVILLFFQNLLQSQIPSPPLSCTPGGSVVLPTLFSHWKMFILSHSFWICFSWASIIQPLPKCSNLKFVFLFTRMPFNFTYILRSFSSAASFMASHLQNLPISPDNPYRKHSQYQNFRSPNRFRNTSGTGLLTHSRQEK